MTEPNEQTQPSCFAEGLEEIFLRNRHHQSDLWVEVLGEIPKFSIIGIKGFSGSGKSMFLMQIKARAIMGDTPMKVLLIDAEKSFKIFHFVDLCSELVENLDDTMDHQNSLRKKLEKLQIIFPTEENFDSVIAGLDEKLSNDSQVSMILFDSIGLFFASECLRTRTTENRDEALFNSYLGRLKQLSKKYGVTIVYTKPDYVEESFEYRDNITTLAVKLSKFTTGKFLMKVKSKDQEKEMLFTIDSRGIKLSNESQQSLYSDPNPM